MSEDTRTLEDVIGHSLSDLKASVANEQPKEDEHGNTVRLVYIGRTWNYPVFNEEFGTEVLDELLDDSGLFWETGPDPTDLFIGEVVSLA